MKLIYENWRKYLKEMTFKRDTKTVIGFDFDHTLARTAGGQVAYFDPQRQHRLQKYPDDINPEYFKKNTKLSGPQHGVEPVPGKTARPAPLNDSAIAKLLALAKKDPEGARKQVLFHMHCDGSDPKPFHISTQAQLDFYAQRGNWKPLWSDSPSGAPNCWAFDVSSRERLEWENGTPIDSVQVPVLKAFKKAVATPGVEVIILTSRVSAVEKLIAKFLSDVNAPTIEQTHIKGVGGKSKGQFLYDDVLSNEKDYDIQNLYFYDDSEANITTISTAVKEAVENDLIEGVGVVYRVSKKDGAYEEAFSLKNSRAEAPGEQDETPI